MTQEEYNSTDWNRGNRVKLTNGKEYSVRAQKKKFLLLYSAEHEAYFIADYHIIECRTSDAIESLKEKAARSGNDNGVRECAHKPQPVEEATATCSVEAAVAEKPKRKRTRITVHHSEKIVY